MDTIQKRKCYWIIKVTTISIVVLAGNIFNVLWTWGRNPRWVSFVTTIVAVCSMFAWLVATAYLTENKK